MILIGQYLSPYTRRVAVALQAYNIPYTHETWSAFTDLDRILPHNPLGRVPSLVLDDNESLFETSAILDYLDECAGPAALIAPTGPERRATLRICALATGLCEKLVAIIYEKRFHTTPSADFLQRCEMQAHAVLAAFETDLAGRPRPYWFGEKLTHADVAATCALTFAGFVNPELTAGNRYPHLAAHVARCEALPAFQATAPTAPRLG